MIASTYEIIKKIGHGGGGNVFLANHMRLGKKVVLKADKRKSTAPKELLRREVDVLKGLSHMYIPQVYDFFIENDTVYTVIDYVEGESLDKPLKRGERFSQAQVIRWAKQILEALSYLHKPEHGDPPRGFVHGDIKPANIMKTPDQNICLIDFNIALALGEENVIGRSPGYASPEHYGLDFSTDEDIKTEKGTFWRRRKEETPDSDLTLTDHTMLEGPADTRTKTIVPDVRSDIYSLGATLYHLLSGRRPEKNAREVTPLSNDECSPEIIRIISKAMNPNPALRYQTADEMLYEISHIRQNDPRVRRLKRIWTIVLSILAVTLLGGITASFVGLKRMQSIELCLKLAEYSSNALADGDIAQAVELALQAVPTGGSILEAPVTPQAQRALSDALGVYDLSDGFKAAGILELPAAPLKIVLSPEGTHAAVVYAYETTVYEWKEQKRVAVLPMQNSALADVIFVDETCLILSGPQGVGAYDLTKEAMIWTGRMATTLALSADGSTLAAVNRDEDHAVIYCVSDGAVIAECSFHGLHLPVAANDIFADPQDELFALNEDGSMLAVSFHNGGLVLFDLSGHGDDLILFEESDYRHFEGGFCGTYFAFAADKSGSSQFGIVDTRKAAFIGGYESQNDLLLQADERGIYLADGNLLVRIDPGTQEEMELAYTGSAGITGFCAQNPYVLAATDDCCFSFYDGSARRMSVQDGGENCDFVLLAGSYAVVGNRNEPTIRLLKLEEHRGEQIFSYDPRFPHEEARISQDGRTAMLFDHNALHVYDRSGELLGQVQMPDAGSIYDQQFVRSPEGSWLEVIWYDGTIRRYSAADGSLLSEEKGERPDSDLYEEFITDNYRIESSLHDTPKAYSLKTGRLVAELEEESYLTYVTQVGENMMTEYISAAGERYGLLLDGQLQTIACLPGLCDIVDGMAVFDDQSGNLRQCRIYSLRELIAFGDELKQQGKERREG